MSIIESHKLETVDKIRKLFKIDIDFFGMLLHNLNAGMNSRLAIPETLICNFGEFSTSFIFRAESPGYLEIINRMSETEIFMAISTFASRAHGTNPAIRIPIAILKCRASPFFKQNKVLFFDVNSAMSAWSEVERSGTPAVMQRFIFKQVGVPNLIVTEVGIDKEPSKSQLYISYYSTSLAKNIETKERGI
jgi:hypothetical protein